jgi:hypothetical protein
MGDGWGRCDCSVGCGAFSVLAYRCIGVEGGTERSAIVTTAPAGIEMPNVSSGSVRRVDQ